MVYLCFRHGGSLPKAMHWSSLATWLYGSPHQDSWEAQTENHLYASIVGELKLQVVKSEPEELGQLVRTSRCLPLGP